MNSRSIGYHDGYMWKQADPITAASAASAALTGAKAGVGFTAESAAALIPWILLFPAAVGVGAGTLHSKLTSPSKTEQETAQKALEVADLEQTAIELERRRQAAAREDRALQQQKETGSARTLRI